MARYHEDWDREREQMRDRDRERERGFMHDRGRREGPVSQRGSEYGSHAGWGGQGFSQGSFGSYGSQGDRLYNQSGGNADYGHIGRQVGGGLSNYSMRNDERYGGQPEHRRPGSDYDHFGRESGAPGFSRQESAWGRERDSDDVRNYDRNDQGRSYQQREYNSPQSNYGGSYASSNYGAGNYGSGSNYSGSAPNYNPNPSSRSDWGQSNWQSGQNSQFTSGRHSGRGPKGYQRSDDRIREDINEHLTRHPEIDAQDIQVDVQNGEVTLKGNVEDRQSKRMAEDVAERVSGVRQVHNQIRVEYQQDQQSSRSYNSGSGAASATSQRPSDMTGVKK